MKLGKQELDESEVGKEPTPASPANKRWERTNVTNLVRNGQSGIYYARVKVNGKEIWRSLKTSLATVAKLRLGDVEKSARSTRRSENAEKIASGQDETTVERFIAIYLKRTADDSSLKPATKSRRDIAIKALRKTWPELVNRDIRRVTPTDCQDWATKALRTGTGFIAPKVKTTRKGMSPSAFNKTVDTLRTIFAIAEEFGLIYKNPAADVKKAKIAAKRLELPSVSEFQSIVRAIAEAGCRQSRDCHDMARLLAYSGMRLSEGNALQWKHVNFAGNTFTVPGSKSESSHRVIPMFPPLRALLLEIRDHRGVEPRDTLILRVNECQKSLAAACAGVGVKRLTHHDLRHLFATRCIELGVDIPTVSKWLGHSDGGALAMKTYGHLRQEHSISQAARINFDGGKIATS